MAKQKGSAESAKVRENAAADRIGAVGSPSGAPTRIEIDTAPTQSPAAEAPSAPSAPSQQASAEQYRAAFVEKEREDVSKREERRRGPERKKTEEETKDKEGQERRAPRPADVARGVAQSDLAPGIRHGDGMHATGYVDTETGEIVDTSDQSRTFYEAPVTNQIFSPNQVITEETAEEWTAPRSEDDEDAGSPAGARRARPAAVAAAVEEEGGQAEQAGSAAPPSVPPSGPASATAAPAPNGEGGGRQVSAENQNMFPEWDLYDNDFFYRGFRRDDKKSVREQYNERMKQWREDYDNEREFPQHTTDIDDVHREFASNFSMDDTDVLDEFESEEYDRQKAQQETRWMYKRGYLPIEGMWADEDGSLRYSPRVESAIKSIRKMYNISQTDVMRLVILRGGIGIDVDKGAPGHSNPNEWEGLTEREFVTACMQIKKSQEMHGHPLGLVDIPLKIAGSNRFPIGVMPSSMADALTQSKDSVLGDRTSAEVADEVKRSWNESVYPSLLENTRQKPQQRWAIENMVRSIAGLDGESAQEWSVADTIPRTYDRIMREAAANPDQADVYEYMQENISKYAERLEKRSRRRPVKDENGNIVGYQDRARRPISDGFMMWANFMRGMGIAGNIPVIASGAVEKTIGSFDMWAANKILWAGQNKRYKPDERIMTFAESAEAVETVSAASVVYSFGEMDAVAVWADRVSKGDLQPTEQDAMRFISEYVQGVSSPGKARELSNRLKKLSDKIVPGDYLFRTSDSRKFFENTLMAMAENGSPIDASTLAEAIEREGAGKVIASMLAQKEGRSALVAMKNLTGARISPLGHMIDTMLRKNGVTNFLMTTCLDTYVKYGVNMIQLIVPMSNTMSYLAVRGLTKEGSSIRDYQLGGNDRSFGRGLVKNFVYDAMKIGNFAAIALLGYCVIEALGFEDPEDEQALGMWDEYRIGGQKIRLAWWMNDLVGWGMPLAVALHAGQRHPERFQEVLLDGIYDMTDGASVLDAIDFIRNSWENIQMIQEMAVNPDADLGDKWKSNVVRSAEWMWATALRKSTPALVNSYGRDTIGLLGADRDTRQADARYVYDRSDEEAIEKGDKTYVENQDELYRRQLAQNSPLYAIWNNLVYNRYLFDDGTTEKTGYLFWEQPAETIKDPLRSYYMDLLEFDREDPSLPQEKEEREAWMAANADNLIKYIEDNWDSPEQALANGFIIPYNARLNATEQCYKRIAELKVDYVQRSMDGEYPDYLSSVAAQTEMQQKQQYYYDLLDNWFKNEDIPWKDEGYEKLLSDNQVYYVWKDSGKPAGPWDYLLNGSAVEKRYEPYGNHPTSFLPFTTVDYSEDWRGYNAETVPNWYVEGLTDTEKIFEATQGKVVPSGMDEGESLSSVLFGGQEMPLSHNGKPGTVYSYNIKPSGQPTIGHRAYVPDEDALPESIKSMTLDDIAAKMGLDMDELDDDLKEAWDNQKKNKNYPVWSSWGGGGWSRSSGGGSSYSPRIYSNPKSINANKAASMYTKTPYGATTTYLRPAFYTKGSREAYRRQDM